MLQYITIPGAVISFVGDFSYIKDTLKGQTKPNRVTFLMWSIAPCIGAAASISDGVTWAALPTLMAGILPFVILLVSFYNSQANWELHWHDYFCGGISLLALVLWKVTHQPVLVVAFAIISDAFAGIPTLIKSWTHPETETPFSYASSLIAAATSFLAIPVWKFTEYAFPTYLVASNLAIYMTIIIRNTMKKRAL